MTNPDSNGPEPEGVVAPWVQHAGWPFEKECWTERTSRQFEDATGDACDALDSDRPLEPALPAELPRTQKLYVLASLLILFLWSMPDGIVTANQWAQIDAYMAENERAKRKPSLDEQRTAIQEILAVEPAHSISFILITTMLERILQETAASRKSTEERPMSPPKTPRGTLRRMTTRAQGRPGPTLHEERSSSALARIFADVMIRTTGGEKAKKDQERRKTEAVEMFIKPGSL